MYSVEMSKHIFIFFHRRVATPLQFFHAKRYCNIPTGTPPPTEASNAGGVGKNAILDRYMASSPVVNAGTTKWIHVATSDRGKCVTLVAGKLRRLLFAGTVDEMFMTLNTTEQNLIVLVVNLKPK